MEGSTFGLTILYFLHITATVVWIGGITTELLFLSPLLKKLTADGQGFQLGFKIRERALQVGWLCLAILVVTGMFQMSANPNYEGFLTIENQWSLAILLKHIVIGILVLMTAYISWVENPKLTREFLRTKAGNDSVMTGGISGHGDRLYWINLLLSLIILGLTAWARSS